MKKRKAKKVSLSEIKRTFPPCPECGNVVGPCRPHDPVGNAARRKKCGICHRAMAQGMIGICSKRQHEGIHHLRCCGETSVRRNKR